MQNIPKKHAELITRLFKAGNTPQDALLHAAVGIAGEAGELLELATTDCAGDDSGDSTFIEEFGDLLFYEGAYRIYCEKYFPEFEGPDMVCPSKLARRGSLAFASRWLSVIACQLLDTTKKFVYYNAPLDLTTVSQQLSDINYVIHTSVLSHLLTMQEVRQHNIDKLNTRYPLGYTDQAAQDRADKQPGFLIPDHTITQLQSNEQ